MNVKENIYILLIYGRRGSNKFDKVRAVLQSPFIYLNIKTKNQYKHLFNMTLPILILTYYFLKTTTITSVVLVPQAAAAPHIRLARHCN